MPWIVSQILRFRLWIEAGGRLVEDQQPWLPSGWGSRRPSTMIAFMTVRQQSTAG